MDDDDDDDGAGADDNDHNNDDFDDDDDDDGSNVDWVNMGFCTREGGVGGSLNIVYIFAQRHT